MNLVNYDTPNEQWAEQFSWIPRAGLVWTALPELNVYGTYAQDICILSFNVFFAKIDILTHII